jgi:hypothetical protein
VLCRSVRDEILLLGVSATSARIHDDTSLKDNNFRVEGSRFESGDNTLTFDEITYSGGDEE